MEGGEGRMEGWMDGQQPPTTTIVKLCSRMQNGSVVREHEVAGLHHEVQAQVPAQTRLEEEGQRLPVLGGERLPEGHFGHVDVLRDDAGGDEPVLLCQNGHAVVRDWRLSGGLCCGHMVVMRRRMAGCPE